MIRYFFNLIFLLALFSGLSLGVRGGVAWAIPDSQHICQAGLVETDSTMFEPIDDDFFVTVSNLFFPHDCVVTLSGDAGADGPNDPDTLLIGYSIDGGSCQFIGPISFVREEKSLETHTAITVIELGPGKHTIQPCFRVENQGTIGGISRRCLIVECRTR
ncbi:MAG: hypothetical protein L0Y68_00465 [Candidatus Dadabacteria bacterium]|nr:hypothetical protein [Candidatus Dadabacteria bacterium]